VGHPALGRTVAALAIRAAHQRQAHQGDEHRRDVGDAMTGSAERTPRSVVEHVAVASEATSHRVRVYPHRRRWSPGWRPPVRDPGDGPWGQSPRTADYPLTRWGGSHEFFPAP